MSDHFQELFGHWRDREPDFEVWNADLTKWIAELHDVRVTRTYEKTPLYVMGEQPKHLKPGETRGPFFAGSFDVVDGPWGLDNRALYYIISRLDGYVGRLGGVLLLYTDARATFLAMNYAEETINARVS